MRKNPVRSTRPEAVGVTPHTVPRAVAKRAGPDGTHVRETGVQDASGSDHDSAHRRKAAVGTTTCTGYTKIPTYARYKEGLDLYPNPRKRHALAKSPNDSQAAPDRTDLIVVCVFGRISRGVQTPIGIDSRTLKEKEGQVANERTALFTECRAIVGGPQASAQGHKDGHDGYGTRGARARIRM